MADQNMPNDASRKNRASGLSGGRSGPGVERNADYTEEVVNRNEPVSTPRRYEQPIEDDGDPVMPSDDSTLNTKI